MWFDNLTVVNDMITTDKYIDCPPNTNIYLVIYLL
jgi:hypothetical protein